MTVQTLTPTQDVADGAGLNITALLTTRRRRRSSSRTPAANGHRRSRRLSRIVTVDIEELIEGQSVSAFPSVTLTESDYYQFGPFHSVLEIPGTSLIQVVLSTITAIQVVLCGHRSLLGPRLSPRSRPA